MPTLAVSKKFLFDLIGQHYTQEHFETLCFEFGVELDEVTSDREIFRREHASALKDPAQRAAIEQALAAKSDDELYKIDTPANRYDILCAEGMAIALRVFNGVIPTPRYRLLPPSLKMTVCRSTRNIRDFVVCAVLRNLSFTAQSYDSFIEFQEKLHGGLARKRTLCSVGTHDLDKIREPFSFECLPREQISFTPLNQKGKILHCANDGLERFYPKDTHIGKYVPLISHLPEYPVILDASRNILSLPPIINSDFSRIEPTTKNIFIECTAPDYPKACTLVNQMVAAFSFYCAEQFTVEAVEVAYEDPSALHEVQKRAYHAAVDAATFRGDETELRALHQKGEPTTESNIDVTPNLALRHMTIDVPTMNSKVGISVDAAACAKLLNRMMLIAEPVDERTVDVQIPVTRSDILHPCDLVEDCAIAYGYDNISMEPVLTRSNGSQTPMNKLAHLLRLEVAAAGYTEMLTLSLCSRDEAFRFLRREDRDIAVHIANPQTVEFQICRPSLLPGTLKALQANKAQALPLRLFEISDVVLKDSTRRTGAKVERHLAAIHVQSESSSLEDIQGLCEYVMRKVGVPRRRNGDGTEEQLAAAGIKYSYYFSAQKCSADEDVFFPGRAMDVVLTEADIRNGKLEGSRSVVIGALGVLHPQVLRSKVLIPVAPDEAPSTMDMPVPCSYLELNLEPLLPVK